MSLVKTVLALGIAVIFALFVSYGLYVIYEPPKYDYYSNSQCNQDYNCDKQLDSCFNQNSNTKDTPNYYQEVDECESKIRQSLEYKTCLESRDKCNEEFQKQTASYIYSRNSFYILFVIGIIAIIAGIFLTGLEGIGSGLIGGGILVVLWSLAYTWQYWISWSKYIKLIALGLVLLILIYLGYKRIESKLKR